MVSDVSDMETLDFQNFIEAGDLTTLLSTGHYDSWSNKGEGQHRTCSRIDWGLGNAAWLSMYGLASVAKPWHLLSLSSSDSMC